MKTSLNTEGRDVAGNEISSTLIYQEHIKIGNMKSHQMFYERWSFLPDVLTIKATSIEITIVAKMVVKSSSC
jgi:hypothetical protein